MTNAQDISKSICKSCEFRFRRVFIPTNPEEYVVEGEDGEPLDVGDNIVIMNMCLASDMDLDLDSTIECTHYRSKSGNKISLFKNNI